MCLVSSIKKKWYFALSVLPSILPCTSGFKIQTVNHSDQEALVVNQKKIPASEYIAVTDVVAKYIEALQIGSVERLADSFHKDAIAYGTVSGKLVGGSSNPTADFIRNYGKSPEIEAHIDVLDITPTTAVVRIIMEKDAIGSDCIEYQTLVKLDEGWAIVAKAFHQFD